MKENNILLSIGIPNYNLGDYIGKTIQSAIAQVGDDIEILISDNCSTDNSRDVINSFSDNRIKVWMQETNLGMQGNWNFVLQQARGQYFLLLPSDDLLNGDFIINFRKEIINHSNLVSTIFWGYGSFSNSPDSYSSIVMPNSADLNIPPVFTPAHDPDYLVNSIHFSPPWCHAQKTDLKKSVGYPYSRRPDSRSFYDVILNNPYLEVVSIALPLSSQRNHATNERNNSSFVGIFEDNLVIADQLLSTGLKHNKLKQIKAYLHFNYAAATFHLFTSLITKRKKKNFKPLFKALQQKRIVSKSFFWAIIYSPIVIAFKIKGLNSINLIQRMHKYLSL